MRRAAFRYQPYYCEENAWWLCQAPELGSDARDVVIVSNAARAVWLREQRAVPAGQPVLWDYHVFVVSGVKIWDLDTRLEFPSSSEAYLEATFSECPAEFAPRFRLVPSELYIRTLATDRSHMRAPNGEWLHPPPPWDPPSGCPSREPSNLQRLIDVSDPWIGTCLSLDELKRLVSA